MSGNNGELVAYKVEVRNYLRRIIQLDESYRKKFMRHRVTMPSGTRMGTYEGIASWSDEDRAWRFQMRAALTALKNTLMLSDDDDTKIWQEIRAEVEQEVETEVQHDG